jgi:hypothetical protein
MTRVFESTQVSGEKLRRHSRFAAIGFQSLISFQAYSSGFI